MNVNVNTLFVLSGKRYMGAFFQSVYLTIFVILFFFASGNAYAQQESLGNRDSMFLENAFKNNKSGNVTMLLFSWSGKDMKSAADQSAFSDTAQLLNRVYRFFISTFLAKKIKGYYKEDGLCEFSLKHAPYLFLQDSFYYGYSDLLLTDSVLNAFKSWREDDNGILPKLKGVDSVNFNKLRSGEHYWNGSSRIKLPVMISKDFYQSVGRNGIFPLVLNTNRRKTVTNFLGYLSYEGSAGAVATSINSNSIAYQDRDARGAFLSSVLKSPRIHTVLMAGNTEPHVVSISFTQIKGSVIVFYRIDGCSYFMSVDLNKMEDTDYKPFSGFLRAS